jgi:hypothetical protein
MRGAILACAILLAPGRARADAASDARAASEFQKGQRAFQAEDFKTAAKAFEAAYAAKPHHDALFNAGRSWQRAGDEIRAANLLERYLREAPADARDRGLARSVLSETAKRAGRIRLELVDVEGAVLDGDPVKSGSYYLTPGEHVVLGDSAKGRVRRAFTVKPGELQYIVVAPDKPETKPEPTTAPAAKPPPPSDPRPREQGEPDRPAEPERSSAPPLPPTVVIVGGALVAIGAGLTVGFGLDAVSKREEFLQDRTQPRLDDVADAQGRTNILLATTIGVAVITGVVAAFFVDWKGDPTKKARLDGHGWRF